MKDGATSEHFDEFQERVTKLESDFKELRKQLDILDSNSL
jgi:hypothetical protein